MKINNGSCLLFTSNVSDDSPAKVDPSELDDLREQIQRKQNTIDGLRSDNEEKEKDWKKKFEELEIAMKGLRNEKNILNMVNYVFR